MISQYAFPPQRWHTGSHQVIVMNDKNILLCFSVQDELERIHQLLKNQYSLIVISSPDELLRSPMADALVLLDWEFVEQHSISLSKALKGTQSQAILYVDSPSSHDDTKILQELDISYVLTKHENDTPFILYTIQKAFDVFSYHKKMVQSLLQYKNQVDKTRQELESARDKLAQASTATQKTDILEEIIYVFKRGEIELPSHPKLSIKFKNLIDRGAGLNQIAELLRQDPAVTTKLISISNSPFYRGMSNNKTLEQAIGRLGLNTAKQYVDVILNRSLYLAKHRDFLEIIERLWEHSLSCAYASQIVARRIKGDFSEDMFTLGLLHDIGKLILIRTIGELRRTNKLGENFEQSEFLTTLKNYHCQFGAALLKRWKFSQIFIDIAAFHNNLSEATTISKSLLVVHFSNLLVHSMGYGLSDESDTDIKNAQSTNLLELQEEDITAIAEEVSRLMNELGDFLK